MVDMQFCDIAAQHLETDDRNMARLRKGFAVGQIF